MYLNTYQKLIAYYNEVFILHHKESSAQMGQ